MKIEQILRYLFFGLLAYFFTILPRTNFPLLFLVYCFLFLTYAFSVKSAWKRTLQATDYYGIFFICILLSITSPNLSDDIYRFIWDGRIGLTNINPYLYTPSEWINLGNAATEDLSKDLYYQLNSPDYYSVYPPLMQWVFQLTAYLSMNSILWNTIFIKSILSISLIVTMVFTGKILDELHLPSGRVLLFVLNPLVLLEVVGNVHFEGLQVMFLSIAVWLLLRQKYIAMGIFWGLAAAVKLWPLLAIPLLIRFLGVRRSLLPVSIAVLIPLVFFLPYFNMEFLRNFTESLKLYYQSFEFNASIYYLFRWLGYAIKGYNWIEMIGPTLAFCFLILLGIFTYRQKRSNTDSLLVYLPLVFCSYLFFSTTIHAWYLITPLFFAIFKMQIYIYIWSITVILSYAAYHYNPVKELAVLIWIQYIAVYIAILFQKSIVLFVEKKINHSKNKIT